MDTHALVTLLPLIIVATVWLIVLVGQLLLDLSVEYETATELFKEKMSSTLISKTGAKRFQRAKIYLKQKIHAEIRWNIWFILELMLILTLVAELYALFFVLMHII